LSWVGIVKDIRPFRAENTKGVVVEAKQPQPTTVQMEVEAA
jgi:hypothetical protein